MRNKIVNHFLPDSSDSNLVFNMLDLVPKKPRIMDVP